MTKQNLLFEVKTTTPLMEQYLEMKARHPDAILLYRVGDFYETFGEDAITTSGVLGITLTSRNNGGSDIELAGFPFHALDNYLPKLVRGGYRVAICEQLEKPGKGKKVLKRGISDIVTPGITLDGRLLDQKKNNYLASFFVQDLEHTGLALADVSTGEFYLAEGNLISLNRMLQNFSPSELLLPKSMKGNFEQLIGSGYYTYFLDDWHYSDSFAYKKLTQHFNVVNLKGFGVDEWRLAQMAAGSLLQYLERNETINPRQLSGMSRLIDQESMWMDKFTIRNLELIHPLNESGQSLINVIDRTTTPMGARMLNKWLLMPLIDRKSIVDRHNAVRFLVQETNLREELLSALNGFGDLERLVAKLPMHKINPREFKAVGKALEKIQKIKVLLCHTSDSLLLESVNALDGCADLHRSIEFALESDAPVALNKGGIFKSGYNRELDDLKYILTNSKDLLLEIQKEESLRTGITNLKIGYNSVFGYYLEVTNKYKNQDIIPPDWIRKQTMSTGERYITSRLKELEDKILGAEEKIISLEEELYKELIESAQAYLMPLQKNARTAALLDCLLGFAIQAEQFQYVQPEITDGDAIMIEGGRHPVIERMLPTGESFIPNDIFIDRDQQQILMITGPNMSGKSAILRQTALICILAQAGSFVPCNKAILGIHDRLFTRVGASDNISSGESTFMVEMNETSAILNNLSARSLVLLDEIGRGTSTYDGISIAWSIACFLHHSPLRPKTLFATHYHELNELGEELPRVKNFHVATKESGKNVIFLRKLLEGGSEHSFGIHVAQMAGMPEAIIRSARKKLAQLESARQHHDGKSEGLNLKVVPINNNSLMEEEILNLNTEAMRPIEALIKLNELQERLRRRLKEE